MLLDLFITTIDAIYRIIHVPTTWKWIEDLYADFKANFLPSPTQLAFFLGTFAGAAYVSRNVLQLETLS